jgi:hypothetical protein
MERARFKRENRTLSDRSWIGGSFRNDLPFELVLEKPVVSRKNALHEILERGSGQVETILDGSHNLGCGPREPPDFDM